MAAKVFIITAPFTQLNTPYPASAYLKGFLNTRGIPAFQADLGIEVTLSIFCKPGLEKIFDHITATNAVLSANAARIVKLQEDYKQTIDDVILFLQGKNPTLAYLISKGDYLPEAGRFLQLADLNWAFGSMGIQDRAKHLATMYLEDLSDLIAESVDPHFGFSRYAEKLGRSANEFDELYAALHLPLTYVDYLLIEALARHIQTVQPVLLAISVPFPGNLYSSLRCAQWVKLNYPHIKIAMGGGFANTELRTVSDKRVFEFFDFICLDDGEAPLENLLDFIEGRKTIAELKRTFTLADDNVVYFNNPLTPDYKQAVVGTPDYSDLLLDKYISAIEVVNPMHRMWSDGRWNKLTMAHGCYWGKCTFCDISLDYIKRYEPMTAELLVNRMEALILQTGQNGFHFVDEAAPPSLMRALAIEIIRRKLTVSWWTNIRFEKSFTRDLCLLLKASGCIAVSGGLEVASDRLLNLIQKGITVAQVARVNRYFTEAGIMVHAYLMYGFPTQTAQETIDSLEMVRQMFQAAVLQSAFWHLFTMTAHSPVGMQPEKFGVKKLTETIGGFANNDLQHIDNNGAEHEVYSFGLKKSLLNYMHGIGFEEPLSKWFEFKVPKTKIDPKFIENVLNEVEPLLFTATAKLIWLGKQPVLEYITKSKKGQQWEMVSLCFENKKQSLIIQLDRGKGDWLASLLPTLCVNNIKQTTLLEIKMAYEAAGFEDFELFWDNKPVNSLYKFGLLRIG